MPRNSRQKTELFAPLFKSYLTIRYFKRHPNCTMDELGSWVQTQLDKLFDPVIQDYFTQGSCPFDLEWVKRCYGADKPILKEEDYPVFNSYYFKERREVLISLLRKKENLEQDLFFIKNF